MNKDKAEAGFSIGYRINQIQTMQFAFKEFEQDEIKQIFSDESKLSLTIDSKVEISKEKSTISFTITTELIYAGEEDIILIKHIGKTVYGIKDLQSLDENSQENFALPEELMIQLFALSYTHCRALIAVEISPTVYKEYFMLPVIDPTDFLKVNGD